MESWDTRYLLTPTRSLPPWGREDSEKHFVPSAHPGALRAAVSALPTPRQFSAAIQDARGTKRARPSIPRRPGW
jgi:hypothetical protein